MPLQRCGDGGNGWKWGKSGKCYTGPDAKQKAIRQMRAIKSQGGEVVNILEIVSELLRTEKEEKEE